MLEALLDHLKTLEQQTFGQLDFECYATTYGHLRDARDDDDVEFLVQVWPQEDGGHAYRIQEIGGDWSQQAEL